MCSMLGLGILSTIFYTVLLVVFIFNCLFQMLPAPLQGLSLLIEGIKVYVISNGNNTMLDNKLTSDLSSLCEKKEAVEVFLAVGLVSCTLLIIGGFIKFSYLILPWLICEFVVLNAATFYVLHISMDGKPHEFYAVLLMVKIIIWISVYIEFLAIRKHSWLLVAREFVLKMKPQVIESRAKPEVIIEIETEETQTNISQPMTEVQEPGITVGHSPCDSPNKK